MKNINTQKVVAGVAALGLSALLAGSVVAANVGGDNFSMNITKDTMYNNGVPSVSVVVGSMAQPVDVVWAGNIAAAIGKKAYTSTGSVGGASLQNVTVEVGSSSTSTVTGDGYLSKDELTINMAYSSANQKMLNNGLIYTDYKALYDDDVSGNITGNSNFTVRQKETLDVNMNTFFSKNNKVKDIMTFVEKDDITYKVTFGDGIDFNSSASEYFATGDTMPIRFMGGWYDLQSGNSTSKRVVLVGSGSKVVKQTGDIITTGNYTIEVGSVTSGSTQRVLLTLKQNGSQVATGLFKVNDEVSFTGYTLTDKIKVVSLDRFDNSPDFVELSVGSEGLLELENNKVLPGYGTSNDIQWKVAVNFTGSKLMSIVVTNDKKVWDLEDKSHSRSGLLMDDVVELPLGLGNINMLGLTDEKLYKFEVGNNQITWNDDRDREYTIPMYERSISGTYRFGVNDYFFDDNSTHMTIRRGTSNTAPIHAGPFSVDTNVTFTLQNGYDTNYLVLKRGNAWDMAFVAPLGSSNKLGKSTKTWAFSGTSTDNNLSNGFEKYYFDYNTSTDTGKYISAFTVSDENTAFYIDTHSQNVARKSDYTRSGYHGSNYVSQVYTTSWTLDQDHSDDLRFAYTPYGSHVEVDGSVARMHLPENKRYLKVFVGKDMSSETTLTGGTLVLSTPGTVVSTEDGQVSAKLVSANVTGGSTGVAITPANWNVNNSRLVYLDNQSMSGAGAKIIVGGHLVNTLAKGITNEYLTQAGQYVVGATGTGDIIVAGFNADDTAEAARELISVIENM